MKKLPLIILLSINFTGLGFIFHQDQVEAEVIYQDCKNYPSGEFSLAEYSIINTQQANQSDNIFFQMCYYDGGDIRIEIQYGDTEFVQVFTATNFTELKNGTVTGSVPAGDQKYEGHFPSSGDPADSILFIQNFDGSQEFVDSIRVVYDGELLYEETHIPVTDSTVAIEPGGSGGKDVECQVPFDSNYEVTFDYIQADRKVFIEDLNGKICTGTLVMHFEDDNENKFDYEITKNSIVTKTNGNQTNTQTIDSGEFTFVFTETESSSQVSNVSFTLSGEDITSQFTVNLKDSEGVSGTFVPSSQRKTDEEKCGEEKNSLGNITTPADPACLNCIDAGGIWLAIGCVDPTPIGILTRLVQTGIGVMGGVALLQLIYVGILYQLGDEAKIQQARGQVMATLTGLAVLVFSILILEVIGVNALDVVPSGFF